MPRFLIPPLARTIVDVRMTKAHHQPQPHPKGCDYCSTSLCHHRTMPFYNPSAHRSQGRHRVAGVVGRTFGPLGFSLRLWVRGGPFALAVVLAAGAAPHALAQVRIVGSVFRADVHPDYPWVEGAKGIEHWYDQSYHAAGLVRVWVENPGKKAVSATSLTWDGEEYPVDKAILGKDVMWWRLRPDPLPGGTFGQIEVRLREPLKKATKLQVVIGGQTLSADIAPDARPLRLERIAFTDAGDAILWCSVSPKFKGVPQLWVDGKLPAIAESLVLGPWQGVLAVVYSPRKIMSYGSFHCFTLRAGGNLADGAVIRTRDDFFPLGTYGYVTPREYAANSLNMYTSFGAIGPDAFNDLGAYNIRGITPLGGGKGGFEAAPASDTLKHPDLWAYYLQDEPDCGDYSVQDVAEPLRIGSMGMEMAARDRNAYHAEPGKLTYLTVDQTYKPANWFVYGPMADVCAPDHYPLPGHEREIMSTLESCRMGCAPNMLVFVYSAWWPEATKPKPDQPKGRMRFAGEERMHIGYALAGGAQGLSCYIHVTEKAGDDIFHGAGEFPDVWHAIGQMYRETDTVAPLLAVAWPVDGVVTAPAGVYARALLSPAGLVIVALNEGGCKSTDDDFTVKPVKPAKLTVYLPPWLQTVEAAEVGEGKLPRLDAKLVGTKLEVTLPELDTARMILLARPSTMTSLTTRCARVRAGQAEALLRGLQHDQAVQARHNTLLRELPVHYKPYMAIAEAEGAYGMEMTTDWLNPLGEKYNAYEWYGPDKPETKLARWKFDAKAAGDHYFVWQWFSFNKPLKLTVTDADGKAIVEREVHGQGEDFYAVEFSLPAAGQYTVTLGGVAGGGPTSARMARAAFLVPVGEAEILPEKILK